MIGYFYTTTTYSQDALVESQKSATAIFGQEAESPGVLLSPLSTCLGPLDHNTRELSILAPLPEGSLESAIVFSPVRYFCDSYGAAFLIQIYNAIARDGLLAVPYYPEKKAKHTNFWSLPWLESILGKPIRLLENQHIAVFQRSTTKMIPQSILSFFVQQGAACALDFFKDRTRAISENYIKLCRDFIVPPMMPLIEENDNIVSSASVNLTEELDLFLSNMNYSVTGIAYKVAGLRRFLDHYLPEKDNLKVVDIGGGVGFLGVELLLTSPRVCEVVSCEPMPTNIPLARRLYHWFEPRLKNHFKMCPSVAQFYPFDSSIDMLCAFASLLYIPREHLESTLEKAWNALRPGGLFVIHENIKRPCFESKNYHHQMFSVEELEGYLSRFGAIDYYRSSDIQPLDRENTQDLTVFRVIQKRHS